MTNYKQLRGELPPKGGSGQDSYQREFGQMAGIEGDAGLVTTDMPRAYLSQSV